MDLVEKQCTGPCGQSKPIEAFSKRAASKDGHQAWCKACVAERKKNANAPIDPKQQRKHKLKHLYGITVEEWDRMLIAQSGRCDLCTEPMKSPHVDHSHATGEVRGLLCLKCNTMLGHVEQIGLARIEEYLTPSSEFLLMGLEGNSSALLFHRFLSSSYN